MTTYRFGGCLYRCERDYYDAIASEWITAGGLNRQSDVENTFAGNTDKQLAAELLWDCHEYPGTTWDKELLAAAFARGRKGEWK